MGMETISPRFTEYGKYVLIKNDFEAVIFTEESNSPIPVFSLIEKALTTQVVIESGTLKLMVVTALVL